MPRPRNTLFERIWDEANEESFQFARQFKDRCLYFPNAKGLRDFALTRIVDDGLVLEFGVFRGASINYIAKHFQRRGDQRLIYGFDSFEGLEEDWTGHFSPRGSRFNLKGRMPEVEANVRLTKGWINETLPPFLETHKDAIAFIHIDTDTYRPAKTILELCKDRLAPDCLILFDDYLGVPNWQNHEHKALNEVLDANAYEYLAFADQAALIRVPGRD